MKKQILCYSLLAIVWCTVCYIYVPIIFPPRMAIVVLRNNDNIQGGWTVYDNVTVDEAAEIVKWNRVVFGADKIDFEVKEKGFRMPVGSEVTR